MSDAENNKPKVNGQDLYEFAVVRYVPRFTFRICSVFMATRS